VANGKVFAMNEADVRSVRILFDLQACQTTSSADRGVGRYSKALFKAVAGLAPPRQVYGLLSRQHPTIPHFDGVSASRLIKIDPIPDFGSGKNDSLGSHLYSAAAATLFPDVVHISHVFEGFAEKVYLPNLASRPYGQVISATLYDLIPLRYPDQYLRNPEFKDWYMRRLAFYFQADLLLAISEASRRDAIDLLGIDKDKIVTIYGGVEGKFQPIAGLQPTYEKLRRKYNLNKPGIILYAGGDDYRKNLVGAIQAFAALPEALRATHQLVILCAIDSDRKHHFLTTAKKLGLNDTDVCFLGFVPDSDLVGFYGICDVFFFPSLFEGLGLPVLEAMASGAPVLCGDNSSLDELIDRSDAKFDSNDSLSIADRLVAVLTNKSFAQELRDYGMKRAQEFSWEASANLAINAFDDALSRKRTSAVVASMSGVVSRPRLAMFTPLPPARSGIADYNAQFLPFLSQHFIIDLFVDGYNCTDTVITSQFDIYDISKFRGVAEHYDYILYEFGNSEFHHHMLPLLEEFPGVVGLHDAFLSGLMGYVEFNLGRKYRYSQEMLHSHAGAARRLFAPVMQVQDPVGTSMVQLPCTRRILDQAIGLISHSKFNLDVAREAYPQGWRAPYRIIPQMVKSAGKPTQRQRLLAREKLGYKHDDFIVATFGHITWNKCGDRLLKGFLESGLSANAKCNLVFVGELPQDGYGAALKDEIFKARLEDRIRITGFCTDEIYELYLSAADVAVQLRTFSRGGTPRGVLDCLSHAVPVIVNEAGSYVDYPDDVVTKLASDPNPAEIGNCLYSFFLDEHRCHVLGMGGLRHVQSLHNPVELAAQYAAAIREFGSMHSAAQLPAFVRTTAPELAPLADPAKGIKAAAEYFAKRPIPSFERRRIFVDVSHIVKFDHKTGIQRVVRELTKALYCSSRNDFEAIAVRREGDQLVLSKDWLNELEVLLPFEAASSSTDGDPIRMKPGDHLLMLDSSWDEYGHFERVFETARATDVPITTVIYDLLPIRLTSGDFVEGGKEWFERWLRSAISSSDSLVCISRAVADDLIDYIIQNSLARPGLRVGWWHLGSTIPMVSSSKVRSSIEGTTMGKYCLMVGTIEPRKNHALTLDAFEMLWAEGLELSLVIAGKPGWMMDEFIKRVRNHPQLNKRLFIFNDASDSEIVRLYEQCFMLLFLSKGEGFGLPIVEASHYGKPVVCSRISSFLEIAHDHAIFVSIEAPDRLANDLGLAHSRIQTGEAPNSALMPRLTWDESGVQLLKVILDDNWYWTSQPVLS
jgi:glycosyltransferase involved in cell wall biosynthesis